MAEVSLFFLRTRAVIDTLTVDASLSEQHTSEVEVTEHPVEVGASITDHLRPKPDMLVLEGVVSNDPMPSSADPDLPRSSGTALFSTHSESDATRAGQAYRTLLALKESGHLITVVTSLRSYDNMALKSLSVPRSPQSGQALRFSATFIEVKLVSNREVVLPAQPKQKLGKKATPVAPPETKKTLLKDISDTTGATGFFSGLLGG